MTFFRPQRETTTVSEKVFTLSWDCTRTRLSPQTPVPSSRTARGFCLAQGGVGQQNVLTRPFSSQAVLWKKP